MSPRTRRGGIGETRDPDAPGDSVRARRAVSLCFLVNGALLASWVPHIPDLKSRLDLGDSALGWLLLAMAGGAIGALPLAGWLVGRLGSRTVTSASAATLSASLVLPVLAPSVSSSAAALVLLGASNAALDVAMNVQGAMVEDRYQRPIMSSFHALFSLGGLIGAVVAGASMAAGVSAVAHVAAVGLLSLAVVAVARAGLLPSKPRRLRDPVFALPPASLVTLGILTFCALLAEGAIGDWSAVYLRDSVRSTPALAAMGFATFSLAMALGRFAGDGLAHRLGPVRLVRCSGVLAAAGLAAALISGRALPTLVGFALVGAGLANLIPVLFSAAARTPEVPAGTAIAAAATTGYFGFLVGPPLIGFAAEVAGLRTALGIVCVACAVVAVGATIISSRAVAFPPSQIGREGTGGTRRIMHG